MRINNTNKQNLSISQTDTRAEIALFSQLVSHPNQKKNTFKPVMDEAVPRTYTTIKQTNKSTKQKTNPNKNLSLNEAEDGIAYLINVLGKQIGAFTFKGLSYGFKAIADYRITAAKYAEDRYQKIFTNPYIFKNTPLKNLYNIDTPLGKAMSILLPKEFRGGLTTEEAIEVSKRTGGKFKSRANKINAASYGINLFTNMASMMNGLEKATAFEKSTVISDTAASAAKLSYEILHSIGADEYALALAHQNNAYHYNAHHLLKKSQLFGLVSGLVLVLSGMSRIANELSQDEMKPSTIFAGSMDIGDGALSFIFANHYLKEAAKISKTSISSGNEALMGYVPWSKFLTLSSRLFGSIAGVVGLSNSSKGLYQAVTDDSMSNIDKFSNFLGLVSSIFFLIGVFTFNPATQTISRKFSLAAFALSVFQTLIDYREELGSSFGKLNKQLKAVFDTIQNEHTNDELLAMVSKTS